MARVLILEPNAEIRELLRRVVSQRGHEALVPEEVPRRAFGDVDAVVLEPEWAPALALVRTPDGSRPLVAVQRYGQGRSLVFTGEASWRWRMLLPSSDRSYDRFWRQAIRWLSVPATDPVHVLVPAGGAPGDTLPLRVAARNGAFELQRDATVALRVTHPDGHLEEVAAAAPDGSGGSAAFAAAFRPGQPGVYRVTAEARRGAAGLGAASAAMPVGGADLEMTDPRLNLPVLQRAALASGGRVVAEHDLVRGDGHSTTTGEVNEGPGRAVLDDREAVRDELEMDEKVGLRDGIPRATAGPDRVHGPRRQAPGPVRCRGSC